MKKIIITFFACIITCISFGQAGTYFHDRIDTTIYATTTGTNIYTGTNTNTNFNVAHYTRGLLVSTFIAHGNTGAATYRLITASGTLSSVAIKKQNGTALSSGDIPDSSAVFLLYYGSFWRLVGIYSSSPSWLLTGNSGTNTLNNFVGTVDNRSLSFGANSIRYMMLDSLGTLRINDVGVNRDFTNQYTGLGLVGDSIYSSIQSYSPLRGDLVLNPFGNDVSVNTILPKATFHVTSQDYVPNDSGYVFRVDNNSHSALFKISNAGVTRVNGSFQYVDGNQGAGKVLTSDASGHATWQTAAGGSQTLAQTLGFGNTTTGHDIIMTGADVLKSSTGGGELSFANIANTFWITTDNHGFSSNGSYIAAQSNFGIVQGYNFAGVGVNGCQTYWSNLASIVNIAPNTYSVNAGGTKIQDPTGVSYISNLTGGWDIEHTTPSSGNVTIGFSTPNVSIGADPLTVPGAITNIYSTLYLPGAGTPGLNKVLTCTDAFGTATWQNPDNGSFIDTITQTNAGAASINKMKFRVTEFSDGITIVNDTAITISHTGTYNIQFSVQANKSDGGADDIDIWLRHNGVNLSYTNGRQTIANIGGSDVVGWNILVTAIAGDYFTWVWSSADTAMQLLAQSGLTSPVRASIPSTALSVNKIK